ncbi:nickel pincer cofactor biosynthesis protein LarC [Acidothermaceae bacterium B102]|nr:nickel pincer cofactor biosynthesis protein LarC [Acidothermaceae bacterium B102]
MSLVGWWDCAAGASGDMMLGALVDVGVPLSTLQAAVDTLGAPVSLSASLVERHGIGATQVRVVATGPEGERTWADIRALLEAAALDDAVRALALATFARLAAAEAAVHRTTPEAVHFHEVGGLDAIADVVGVAAGLVSLGLSATSASTVTLGHGTAARGRHGLVPVPAPAVLSLLADAGAPVQAGPAPYEMCTPTGAALLASTISGWGSLPAMRVTRVGVGAGGRDPAEVPNLLRLVIGETVDETPDDTQLVIETNVDDLDPRVWPSVLASLLAAGAADAWLTPILMKKGRPAHTLSVLVPDAKADAVRRVVFTETSTLGVRESRYGKRALSRELATVTVDGVAIRVKIGRLDGLIVNAQPEWEDVAAAAASLGRPVIAVLAAANAAAHAAGLAP